LPFFFSGLAVGVMIARLPMGVGRTYAANLTGSAAGCLLALAAPGLLGGEGIVTLSACLAMLAATSAILGGKSFEGKINLALACAGLVFTLIDLGLRLGGTGGFSFFRLQISPYKSLSYILQQPGAQVLSSQWNAFSRVDVVSSANIHSFPGLSYRYLQPLPIQKGLLVDGDGLSPLISPNENMHFSAYLPDAIAYLLRPQADVLVLGAAGGLEALAALDRGAAQVDAVEGNPLVIATALSDADPRIHIISSDERTYLRNTLSHYDVLVLPLNNAFHPIRSGAYSLAEDYHHTIEAFEDMLSVLNQEGILVMTRWLQNPPSEDLRTFALAVAALDESRLDARERIVVMRGYNTATFLIKTQPFNEQELAAIRQFASERAFDLIYAPGILPQDANRYNILPEPIYFQTYRALLAANPREAFYQQYPFDVRPPTDDHPFFGHFFKWSQAGQILAEFGKTWQPFGGAGYFVILALLAMTIVLAASLILLPLSMVHRRTTKLKSSHAHPAGTLLYFGLIGFAYLFVEIPLIQKFILFLGNPAYAMTAVLFTLLFFSGMGSWLGKRISLWLSLALLAVMILALPAGMSILFQLTLGVPLTQRLLLTVLGLAPVGFLMGIPFQAGIRQMEASGFADTIPWAWAVNGSTSVVAAVLAALLALTFGFTGVLRLGAICYAGALIIWRFRPRSHGDRVGTQGAPLPVNGTKETPPML
jgi:spermidine synthase